MRISEWSADVCSSDRHVERILFGYDPRPRLKHIAPELCLPFVNPQQGIAHRRPEIGRPRVGAPAKLAVPAMNQFVRQQRSEEHTSELQSLMRISYAVFCLKKKKKQSHTTSNTQVSHITHQK